MPDGQDDRTADAEKAASGFVANGSDTRKEPQVSPVMESQASQTSSPTGPTMNAAVGQTSRKVWYAPNRFEAYGEAEIKAVEDCLRDGWLAGFGPRTVEFERRVAALFGKQYALFVNSGSSAVLLALCALNLGPGDEIVTPACTFATTVAPILQVGATPIFTDVGRDTYVCSVDDLKMVVTNRTKAILLPNLIGNLPDWPAIRAAFPNIVLIEDSADTIIKSECTDISTTSFYASHVITAGGTGGMVMFNDAGHLARATMFRDWGRIGDNEEDPSGRFAHSVDDIPYDWKFLYGVAGYNFKASEMNAAFGLAQLDRLEELLAKRRKIVQRYLEQLSDCEYYLLPDDSMKPNWLALPLQCPDRLELLTFLEANSVQTRVCFAGNITRHPAFRSYLKEFPVSDSIMARGFLLGAHHGMELEDVDRVVGLLKQFAASKRL